MRYTIFVFALYFFTACTVPPQNLPVAKAESTMPVAKESVPVAQPVTLPEIEVKAVRSKARKSPCIDINTGDPKDDVRAKLDCLAQHLGR